MAELVATLEHVGSFLDEVLDWVLKSKQGLTRDEARRIFQRYRAPVKEGEEAQESVAAPAEERTTGQASRLMSYMEQTNLRLDQIETDLVYIKERVDQILRKL